jgi:hypothetical protein
MLMNHQLTSKTHSSWLSVNWFKPVLGVSPAFQCGAALPLPTLARIGSENATNMVNESGTQYLILDIRYSLIQV